MKTKTFFIGLSFLLVIALIFTHCDQKMNKTNDAIKIENTLKSVSLWYDSAGIDPARLLASLERVNTAIDSIGYPDAGYKLWMVQSDTSKDYRFMVEGYWPDQETYDLIHKHELYINADKDAEQEDLWAGLKSVSYNRFILVR
jgi:hypothetical protein